MPWTEERRARQSAATKRQMAFPKARERAAEYARDGWKESGHAARFVVTDEIKAKISAAQAGKVRAWTLDPDRACAIRQKQAETMRQIAKAHPERFPILTDPDVRERACRNSVEEGLTNPLRGKFETNVHATEWQMRDPRRNEYRFRNLLHFIRTHEYLFTPEQLILSGKGIPRAYVCLLNLRPGRRSTSETACGGWTWLHDRPEGALVERPPV